MRPMGHAAREPRHEILLMRHAARGTRVRDDTYGPPYVRLYRPIPDLSSQNVGPNKQMSKIGRHLNLWGPTFFSPIRCENFL